MIKEDPRFTKFSSSDRVGSDFDYARDYSIERCSQRRALYSALYNIQKFSKGAEIGNSIGYGADF